MNKINIIGIGPGNKKYITPIALEFLESSDTLIGGKRNLQELNHLKQTSQKTFIELKNNLNEIIEYIKLNRKLRKISIVASGDPSFYGISSFIKKNFPLSELNIIPGISSIQYLAAKCGLDWNNSGLCSLHGRNEDVIEIIKNKQTTFILTDKNNTPAMIAKLLCQNNLQNTEMIIGSNLSYQDEKIIRNKTKNIINTDNIAQLSVVVVLNG